MAPWIPGQRILDLVSQSCRQPADCREVLGLAHELLHFALPGYILDDEGAPCVIAVLIPYGRAGEDDLNGLAFARPPLGQPVVHRPGAARLFLDLAQLIVA